MIIKEYCKLDNESYKIVIRRREYGHTFAMIGKLVVIAHNDFGFVDENEIEIIQYGGRHYKHTWGIEFEVYQSPPEVYQEIDQLEFTL